MKYIKDLNKLYGPIKALDQMGTVDNMSYFEKSYNRLKKELKTSEVLKKFISLFLNEEIKADFKEMTVKDLNEEIGKDLFTKEEYDLLKEVLL